MSVESYKVCLSLQRALLDAVTPALRRVSFELEGDRLEIFFFYDGEVSEDEENLVGNVGAEVIADFPNCDIDWKTIAIKWPNKIPSSGRIIYNRYEES